LAGIEELRILVEAHLGQAVTDHLEGE